MEFSEHVIDFEKRSATKSQVLVDFIADWIELADYTKGPITESPWQVYYDGAWGNARAEASTILVSPSGIKLRYATRLQFTKEIDRCATNIIEYEVILLGLQKLQAMGVQSYIIKTDSKVIATQIKKECIARDARLEKYLALVRRMENYFKGFSVEHVERNTTMPPDVFFPNN
jgi:ribonuclease HI